jgi:hypothetical protein
MGALRPYKGFNMCFHATIYAFVLAIGPEKRACIQSAHQYYLPTLLGGVRGADRPMKLYIAIIFFVSTVVNAYLFFWYKEQSSTSIDGLDLG